MFGQVAVLVGIGAAFNLTKQVRKDGDPYATLLAAGAFLGILGVVGQTLDYRVAKTIAGLYAFGSFVQNGEPLVATISALVGPSQEAKDKARDKALYQQGGKYKDKVQAARP